MRFTNWSRTHSMLVGKRQLWTVFLSPLGSFRTLFHLPVRSFTSQRSHLPDTRLLCSSSLFHARVLYPALSPMFCLFADNLMCLSGLNASLFLEAFNSTTWALQLQKVVPVSGNLKSDRTTSSQKNRAAFFHSWADRFDPHCWAALYILPDDSSDEQRSSSQTPWLVDSVFHWDLGCSPAEILQSCQPPLCSLWFLCTLNLLLDLSSSYLLKDILDPGYKISMHSRHYTAPHFLLKAVPKWQMLWWVVQ